MILTSLLLAASLPSSAATLEGFQKQFRGTRASETAVKAADTVSRAEAAGSAAGYDASETSGALIKATLFLMAAPFAHAHGLDPQGYSRWLYADSRGDLGDAPRQQRLELSYQRVGSYVDGWSGRWRLDTERHLGLEAFWTDYIEHRTEDLHYVGASAHGDVWRAESGRVDYSLGLAALSGRLTRVGPRLGIDAEAYPCRPFFIDALAAVTFIDGGPLGELRAGGGVNWKRAQARLSYRALIGPFKNLAGPELALSFRL